MEFVMGGVAVGPARAMLLVLSCPTAPPGIESAVFTTLHFAVAYFRLKDAGFELVVATPSGGRPAVVAPPVALGEHLLLERYRRDRNARDDLAECLRLDQVEPDDFRSALVVASHGGLQALEADRHGAGLVCALSGPDCALALVGAAPALLCDALHAGRRALTAARHVTGASRAEEHQALGRCPPHGIAVEDRLRQAGFLYSAGPPWHPYIVRDGALITAQNLQSLELAADALIRVSA